MKLGSQLLVGDFFAFEIAHHQVFIVLGDGFDECLAIEGDIVFQLGREILLLVLAVAVLLEDEGTPVEKVHDTAEILFLADRELEWRHAFPERFDHRFERLPEVGVLAVHLVDEEHARQADALGVVPDLLCPDLDAGCRVDHDDRRVDDAHRGTDVTAEVRVVGRIDDVDLAVVVLDGDDAVGEGKMPLDLFGIRVGNRRAQRDTPAAGDGPRIEQHCFDQRRAAGLAVRKDTDVKDAIRGVLSHNAFSPGK